MLCVLAVCLVMLLYRSKIPHSLHDQDTHIKIHMYLIFGVQFIQWGSPPVYWIISPCAQKEMHECMYADTCEQVCKDADVTYPMTDLIPEL